MTTAPPLPDLAMPAPVRPRRRRASRVLLLAVLLAVVGALAGVAVFGLTVSREAVVATARALPEGTTIQLGDLREVALPPGTGLATVAWDEVESLVGQVTATDVPAGQVVSRDVVTAARSPAPGEAVVGLSLAPGRVPATTLGTGDGVLVVVGDGALVRRAVVLRDGAVDTAGRRSLDVVVPQADAAVVAVAAAAEQVAVALVPRG